MNNINLYGHCGSANHGCEAIIRSTAKLLNRPITVWSGAAEQDLTYGLDQIVAVKEDLDCPPQKPSLAYYLSAMEIKTRHSTSLHTRFRHRNLLTHVDRGSLYLSVGGDNYCYAGIETIFELNEWLHKRGARTVLWGCSVEPELLKNPAVVEDLKKHALITARESLTYQAMIDAGLTNVILCADPAFCLEKQERPLPVGFLPGKTVGINISPLAMDCGTGTSVMDNYMELMQFILKNTDFQIALIPHVVVKGNDDRVALAKLYEAYQHTGRVINIEDQSCEALKGLIAHCRFFVGARTHATIAAYSTCVPTLVSGYSVKARGIARDLFGAEDHYVVSVQGLDRPDILWEAFLWIMEHETHIRTYLEKTMPEYCKKSYIAVEKLSECCLVGE